VRTDHVIGKRTIALAFKRRKKTANIRIKLLVCVIVMRNPTHHVSTVIRGVGVTHLRYPVRKA